MKFSSLVAGFVLVAGASTSYAVPPPPATPGIPACHLISPGDNFPAGYGSPYNLLSEQEELLLSVSCTSTDAILRVGSGAPNQYVYHRGYIYRDESWHPFDLSHVAEAADHAGGVRRIGDWFVGTAQATLPRTVVGQDQGSRSPHTYVVAYICTLTGTGWKCGCRDEACTRSFWQLQSFRSDASGVPLAGDSGMTLEWSWTPEPSDKGRSGEDAAYWAKPPVTPQHAGTVAGGNQLNIHQGRWSIAEAPDGTLSFQWTIPKGEHSGGSIIPVIFPDNPSEAVDVMRVRYRMYVDANFHKASNESHMKFPGGMVMGPVVRAGGEPFSKAGENCNQAARDFRTDHDLGASTRVTVSGDPPETVRLYTYHVPDPEKDCPVRKQYISDYFLETGKWLDVELEFKNQSGRGKADGYQKMLVNGELINEVKDILWIRPDRDPQAFRGPWFSFYYGGCCPKLERDAKFWLRDIEVWAQ